MTKRSSFTPGLAKISLAVLVLVNALTLFLTICWFNNTIQLSSQTTLSQDIRLRGVDWIRIEGDQPISAHAENSRNFLLYNEDAGSKLEGSAVLSANTRLYSADETALPPGTWEVFNSGGTSRNLLRLTSAEPITVTIKPYPPYYIFIFAYWALLAFLSSALAVNCLIPKAKAKQAC